MNLYTYAAKSTREIANHFARLFRVSIDVNCQLRSTGSINPNCSTQNF